MKTTSKSNPHMTCTHCHKSYDIRDIAQVLYHETECEPKEVHLPENAGTIRLEDTLPSITPQELLLGQVHHICPLSIGEVVRLIKKVTSSL